MTDRDDEREQILRNFRPTPPAAMGDVFFSIKLPEGQKITSCEASLAATFERYKLDQEDFARVEVQWWCEDRNLDVAAVWPNVQLEHYSIGRDGVLRPVSDNAGYQKLRGDADREVRRFALVDRQLTREQILEALEIRIERVFKTRPKLRF